MTAQADVGSPTGATRFVEALEALGVEVVFGLPGVHNLPIWDALRGSAIRLVGVRHEQAAAYAADGYYRATGRLGVALVTTGPGAANTVAAFGEARASGSAVIVVATEASTRLRRAGTVRGVLHEMADQAALFAPLAKQAQSLLRSEDIQAVTVAAGRMALAAPTGPVYLGLPTDLLGEVPPDVTSHDDADRSAGALPSVDLRDIASAAGEIDAAERVLIWAGGGALRAGAGPAIDALATRLASPVATTFGARGILPPDHPCLAPAMVLVPEIGALWDDADLVIAVGTDFDGMTTQNWAMPAPRRLIAVNVDPRDAAKSYVPDRLLVGDARVVVDALAETVVPRDGMQELRRRLLAIRSAIADRISTEEPAAANLLAATAEIVPQDAAVFLDMCVAGYWLAAFHRVQRPRALAYPMGWGTLGFGFPAALGAAAAGLRTVCFVGDGGFLFACGELATAVQEQLPLTVVVVDDGGYGMLRFDQEREGMAAYGVDLLTPDFVLLAEAFGVPATLIDGFGDDFRAALQAGLAMGRPNLLVVRARLLPPPTISMRWYRHGRYEARLVARIR